MGTIRHKQPIIGAIGLILSILLATGMLFCLAGCGQDKDSATSGQGQTAVSPGDTGMEEAGPSPMSAGPPAANTDQQQLQQKVTRFNQLKQDLKTIQDAAIEKNPDLKKQQEALQLLVQETLQENLETAGLDLENIKQMQQDLQQEDMPQNEKEQLAAEFRQKVQAYSRVQRETMTDENITEKTNAFRDGLEKAMKKENPQSGEMMEELKALLTELQQIQMQQNQQTSPQAPATSAQ